MAKIEELSEDRIKGYEDKFNEPGFWNKIKKYGKTAGAKVVYNALKLYYAATAKETPTGIKALIYGALGYFILPIDLISDFIPVIGFTDDLVALGTAIASASAYITPAVKKQAKDKLEDLFDDVSDSDLED